MVMHEYNVEGVYSVLIGGTCSECIYQKAGSGIYRQCECE